MFELLLCATLTRAPQDPRPFGASDPAFLDAMLSHRWGSNPTSEQRGRRNHGCDNGCSYCCACCNSDTSEHWCDGYGGCSGTGYCGCGYGCGPGYHSPTGSGCTACPEHTYQDVNRFKGGQEGCKPQPVCGPGTRSPSDQKAARGDCILCGNGTFQSNESHYHTACIPQPACGRGEKSSPSSATSKQTCTPCNGTVEYQDTTNHRNVECKPQPTCGRGEKSSPSSPTSEQTCIPCNGTVEYQDATNHRNVECKPQPILPCSCSEAVVFAPDPAALFLGCKPASIVVATLESQICPGSSAGVAVLATLMVMSLAANVWFGFKNRDMAKQLQQQFAEKELGGGQRQTVEMTTNPLARRRSLGPQSAGRVAGRAERAAGAIPPQGQTAAAYSEPPINSVQTHESADGANYAPVYAVYAASPSLSSTPTSAAGMPLDSDNYVLDTSA